MNRTATPTTARSTKDVKIAHPGPGYPVDTAYGGAAGDVSAPFGRPPSPADWPIRFTHAVPLTAPIPPAVNLPGPFACNPVVPLAGTGSAQPAPHASRTDAS